MNFVEGCKSVQEVKAVAVELLKQSKGLTLEPPRVSWRVFYL